MSNDLECPYCGHESEFCFDDGAEEDRRYEQECEGCEKTFVAVPYYIVGFHEYKADCLNGGTKHEAILTSFRGDRTVKICEDCGVTISAETFHL